MRRDFGPGAGGHYTIAHLREMGAAFVPALLELTDPTQARVGAILADLEQQFPAAEDDADECDNADGADGGAPTHGRATRWAGVPSCSARCAAPARNPVSASKGSAGGRSSASSAAPGSKSGAGKRAGDKKHDKGDRP